MPADLLEQGHERPGPRTRSPAALVVLALAVLALVVLAPLVVASGALQRRGDEPAPGPSPEQPPPGVLLESASVLSVRDTLAGRLHVRIGVEGGSRVRLQSVRVDLPGTVLEQLPSPDRLTDDGAGLLVVDLLPRCPDALAGLSRGAVTATVRAREGAPAVQVRVRLDTDGVLAQAVRARCGTVERVPELRISPVALDGPAGDPLRTRVEVSAAGAGPVTVVAVRPGPGLQTALRTPLPVVVRPGGPPAVLRVDLRLEGCGGAPDTPPYLLVLADGEAVATSVTPEVQPPLGGLRPYQCAG